MSFTKLDTSILSPSKLGSVFSSKIKIWVESSVVFENMLADLEKNDLGQLHKVYVHRLSLYAY